MKHEAKPTSETSSAGTIPAVGEMVGPYEILGELGRGGMAVVLEAKHQESGDIRAIKLMLPRATNAETRARFLREFKALSQLAHENITRVYEAGFLEDRPYFVMERLNGRSLRDEVQSWKEIVRRDRFERVESILTELTRALAHLHGNGLIHRDITPTNIMILDDGTTKLMDFGVVKDASGDLTVDGEVVGTVAYIAPEQITGGKIDARVDLYALGAVLYFMLTGRRPFNARTLAGYLEKHLHRKPRAPRELVPLIPEYLETICLRLLEKKPQDRINSALHLTELLSSDSWEGEFSNSWPERMVGRTAEEARLHESLSALAEGKGGFVLLEGSSGSGKTTLLNAFGTLCNKAGLNVFHGGHGLSHRPMSSFRPVYDRLAHLLPTEIPELLRQTMEEPDALQAPVARSTIHAAIGQLLSQVTPAALLLDDLDKADPSSIGLTAFLVSLAEATQHPLLIVATRDCSQGAREVYEILEAAQEAGSGKHIEIAPLSISAVEELLLTVLPNQDGLHSLAKRLATEADGNALYITQMIRGLVDETVIAFPDDERPKLQVDPADITHASLPVPATIRDALRDRITPLSDGARDLALVFAAARLELDLDLLGEISERDLVEIEDELDELVESGIVTERRVGHEERFEIGQALIREVLLEGCPPDARQRLHRRIGAALERGYRNRLGPVVDLLAYHFEQGNLVAKAYTYLSRSGEQLRKRSFYTEALEHFDRAVALESRAREFMTLEDADRALARLRLERNRCCDHLGLCVEAEADARAAQAIGELLNDDAIRAEAAGDIGIALRRKLDQEGAITQFRKSRDLAERAGDTRQKVVALNRLGSAQWATNNLDMAKAHFVEALALCETLTNRSQMADCYNGLAIVAICRGQSADARRYLEQACQLYEEHMRISELSTARVNLVELNHLTGNFKRALELIDQTLAQARSTHHREGQAVGLRYRALVLTDLGRTAEAVQNAEEALKRIREIGAEDEMLGIYTVLARSYLAHEDPQNAADWVALGRKLSGEHDLEGYGPILTAWAGHVAAKTGDNATASMLVNSALDASQKGWPHQLTRLNLISARTLALINETPRARELAQTALNSSEACGYRYYALKAHHLLARLADDEDTAHHHQRIAKALQRSLAGNLTSDDAKSFNRIIHQTLPGF